MSMKKTLAELEAGGLKWVTPSMWKSEQELRTASGEVIARIHRPKTWNYS
ncbi:MAG: hypothetical protein SGI73_00415 [Chloroflexota bacterium]|nr:hypothetical protein [Chloroflexota bacterium]